MTRVVVLARTVNPDWLLNAVRSTLVLFCAAALIAASRALPF